MNAASPAATRHRATTDLLRWFDHAHLPPHLQAIAEPFQGLAFDMAACLPDGPELTAGLRKLLEAKDCMVRQAILARDQASHALGQLTA